MKNRIIITILTAAFCGCTGYTSAGQHAVPIYDKDPELGITAVPESMGRRYTEAFDRYTSVTAPSGGKIQIVAQNRITNEQILRARGILTHYLSDTDGLLFGGDKASVADMMAENGAVLSLLNYRDDGSNKTEVPAQSLFEEELPVDGSSWYTENQYEQHRDAGFEEILHLVHDYGIGVDGAGGQSGALPEVQKKIRSAQENAVNNKMWGIGSLAEGGWLAELKAENSLTQEYLAAVIDSWYGLWGAWNDSSVPESSTNGMWGGYIAKTRAEVETEDSDGAALAQSLFTPWLCYNSRIDSEFSGTFHMDFDAAVPYTHKSQYLKDITLTGSNDTSVKINSLNNNITGNSGSNTVIFSGDSADYTITSEDGTVKVSDSVTGRDGENVLKSVEYLSFGDKTIPAP